MADSQLTKTCSRCKEEKPVSEFTLCKSNVSGYQYSCRTCRRKSRKEYVKRNQEHIKELRRLSRVRTRANRLAQLKQWKADNRERVRITSRAYKKAYKKANKFRQYGLDQNAYDAMAKNQNGKCAICNSAETYSKRELAIDHCHKSNRVRGLLCTRCNWMLGIASDDVRLLANAIAYLNRWA